jgi:hypothetical protein
MNPRQPPTLEQLLGDPRPIEKAMQQAVREALSKHRSAGNPIAEWRAGKVVWIPPQEIPILDSAAPASLPAATPSESV